MNKKLMVKQLLELATELPTKEIPTTKDGSIDFDRFHEVPLIKATITILRFLNVDGEWLGSKGFIPATLVYGRYLNKDCTCEKGKKNNPPFHIRSCELMKA